MRKAIVIGAGFGGIAAAVRLKKKGYEVEIVDRCNNLGGRAQFFNKEGFIRHKNSFVFDNHMRPQHHFITDHWNIYWFEEMDEKFWRERLG